MVKTIIAIVVILDLVLMAVNWRLSAAPHPSSAQARVLQQRRDLIAADVRRAEDIRKSLPNVESESDTFYQKDLRPSDTGDSSVVEDLSKLAKDSGLQVTSTRFQRHAVEKRNVQAVKISISMEGQYSALVRFINGLERSDNFYLLDSLSLDSSNAGTLRLNLELRTYFRS